MAEAMTTVMLQFMKTTISVSRETRDQLAWIAEHELHGVSMDQALKIILFQHQSDRDIARLEADPQALADYQNDMAGLAQTDQAVQE
jgi:hypothetical protein